MTWVPPHGGPPVGPTPPASDPSPAPDPATPSAAPVVPHTTRKGLSTGWVIGIAVIGAIFAGSLIGGIGTGISNANAPSNPYYPYPYDPGPAEPVDSGSPVAVEPLECASACFDLDTAKTAALDDSAFNTAFLPDEVDVSAAPTFTSTEAMAQASADWDQSGLLPDWCFPTFSELPIAETQNSDVDDGEVAKLTENTSETGSPTRLVQTIRVFDSSTSAERYMSDLDAALSQCHLYNDDHDTARVTVTLDDALHPPASVAALGFVRDDSFTTTRIFDIQRGNVVIRSVYTTSSTYDNGKFRPLMQEQADKLDELVPLS